MLLFTNKKTYKDLALEATSTLRHAIDKSKESIEEAKKRKEEAYLEIEVAEASFREIQEKFQAEMTEKKEAIEAMESSVIESEEFIANMETMLPTKAIESAKDA